MITWFTHVYHFPWLSRPNHYIAWFQESQPCLSWLQGMTTPCQPVCDMMVGLPNKVFHKPRSWSYHIISTDKEAILTQSIRIVLSVCSITLALPQSCSHEILPINLLHGSGSLPARIYIHPGLCQQGFTYTPGSASKDLHTPRSWTYHAHR